MRWLSALAAAAVATLCTGAAQGGEVTFGLQAPSGALGRTIPYTMYRPSAEPALRLPVLYLFHGAGGTERDWVEMGRAKETLDRLIEAGRIKPLLVVMPMAGDSWYVDNPDPGGAGPVAQALSQDLAGSIEQAYPALRCREARALGGLSMGGYGALLYAMDNPDRYVAAFSLSGAVFRPMRDDVSVAPPARVFRGAFGEPFDRNRFNTANLFARIPGYAGRAPRPAFFLAVGTDDFPRLREGNLAFHAALAAAGVDVPLRTDPGEHDWTLWASQLEPALVWLDKHLEHRCPRR